MVGAGAGNNGIIGGSSNQIKQERKDDNVSIFFNFFFLGGVN